MKKNVIVGASSYTNCIHFDCGNFHHLNGKVWAFEIDRTVIPTSVMIGDFIVKKWDSGDKYGLYIVKTAQRAGSFTVGQMEDYLADGGGLTAENKKALKRLLEPHFKE